MAANFTPVAPEVQATDVLSSPQTDPDVALLTDGRFAVAYVHRFGLNDMDIRLQFLNADGTLSGNSIAIDQDSGFQFEPVVASRLGGGAVVVWTDVNGFNAGGGFVTDEIQLRMVSAAGAISAPLTVSNGIGARGHPDAAMLANGQVVVVWDSESPDSGIGLRVLNAAGTGFTSTGHPVTDADVSGPAIAASGNKALIAYRDVNGGDILVKLFDGATGTLNSSGDVAGKVVASTDNLARPDVAALTDGRYVVVWDNISNDDIEGRFVDANGDPVGGTFTIANNAGENDNPRVAALPDGGFIVTWESDGGVIAPEDGNDLAILARRFDSTGAPAGDLFLVNTGDPNTDQLAPAVAVNPGTGQAFFAWEDWHSFSGTGQDNDPPGIRGRAFAPTTDAVNGTPGDDTLTTYNLAETINGLDGNDAINALGGNDIVDGGLGDDTLLGGLGDDTMAGGDGTDTVNGEDGNDIVDGGTGDDSLLGGLGDDALAGGDGADTMNGEDGNDVLDGGPGDDSFLGGTGNDTMAGGDGADTMNGEDDNDLIDGGLGGDFLFGGLGDDAMTGGGGADTVNGGDGSDTVNGNLGNDALTGGSGADSFVFNTAIKPKGSNIDTIADFSAADDTILLDNAIFTKLKTEGALKEKWFDVGKKAHDKNDYIVYNKKTGDLLYDKNGDKKGGAILFAKLEGSPDDLSAADFFVI